MIKIKKPIIVEGKYDKITLENTVDALIIPTNGFGIFKDKEKCRLIRLLAEKNVFDILIDKKDKKTYREGEYHGEYHVKGADAGYVFQKAGFEDVAECHVIFSLFRIFIVSIFARNPRQMRIAVMLPVYPALSVL